MKKVIFPLITAMGLLFLLSGCGALISAIIQAVFASQVGVIAIPAIVVATGLSGGQQTAKSGMVLLPPGSSIPDGYIAANGAIVAVFDSSGKIIKQVVTDPNGNYKLEEVEVGIRNIRVTYQDFTSIEQDVVVSEPNAGDRVPSDFKIVPSDTLILSLRKDIQAKPGAHFWFNTYGKDPNGIAFSPDANWAVDKPEANIDEKGHFTTTSSGIYVVTATSKVDSSKTSSVTVKVVDRMITFYGYVKNGIAPVSDAYVYTEDTNLYTVTDPNGYYNLYGIPFADEMTVIGEMKTGLTTAKTVKISDPNTFSLQVDLNFSDISPTPTPGGTLTPTPNVTVLPTAILTPTISLTPTVTFTPTPKWKQIVIPGVSENLRAVYAVDANTVCITGDSGVVAYTGDGGQTWDKKNICPQSLKSVHFIDANTGWVAGDGGQIWHKESGIDWTFQNNPSAQGGHGIRRIYFVNSLRGFAMGETKLLRTNTGGTIWNDYVALDRVYQNVYPDPNDLTALRFVTLATSTNFLTPFFSKFEGEEFKSETAGIVQSNQITGTCMLDLNNIWMVGTDGFILRCVYDASTGQIAYEQQTSITDKNLNGVYFADTVRGMAVGNGGKALYRNSAGLWNAEDVGTLQDLNGIHIVKGVGNEYIIWIVGNSGLVIKSVIN